MASGGDIATIILVCGADGVVQSQARTRKPPKPGDTADGWRSDVSQLSTPAAPGVIEAAGLPLVKTFWFDHLDCDHKELQQIIRRACQGKPDRVRVWVRVDEHQLIRAELTATPLIDEKGKAKQVLVRVDPTRAALASRRRENVAAPGEPLRKRLQAEGDFAGAASDAPAAPPPIDLLSLPLNVPMLRLDPRDTTVVGANTALASLLGREPAALTGLPVSELVEPAHRKALLQALASPGSAARTVEVRLQGANSESVPVQLSILNDPAAADGASALILSVEDRSATHRAAALETHAQDLHSQLLTVQEESATFERLFNRVPVGLAIFKDGQLLRTNAQFESLGTDSAGWIDALTNRARKSGAIAEQQSVRQSLASFPLEDRLADTDLIGAMIVPAPREAIALEQQWLATLNAMQLTGRLALALEANGELYPLGNARDLLGVDGAAQADADRSDLPLTPAMLFDERTVGEYRSAAAHARSSRAAVTTTLMLRDGQRPCYVTIAPQPDGGSALVLIEDRSQAIEQIDAARERARGLQAEVERLNATRIDPVEIDRIRAQADDRRERLRALLRATGAGTFTWDLVDGNLRADARTCELLACQEAGSPLSVASLLAAFDDPSRAAFEQQLFDAMSPGSERGVDLTAFVGPDRAPVRIVGDVQFDTPASDNGEAAGSDPSRFVAAVLDLRSISEAAAAAQDREAAQAQLAAQLRLRTAELDAIFECVPDAIRIHSAGMLRHNDAAAALFGEDVASPFEADAKARIWTQRVLGTDDANGEELLPAQRALNGERASATVDLQPIDGESGPTRTIQSTAAPIIVDDAIAGAVSVDVDLTGQRALEAAVADAEAQVAGFFQNTGVGIAYVSPDGRILNVNPPLSALLGATATDLARRTMHDLSATDDRSVLTGQIDAVLSGEMTSCSSEVRLTRRDGTTVWTQLTVVPRHRGTTGDRSVVVLVQDIDELLRLREQIADEIARRERLTEQLELIRTTISEGFLVLDNAGRLLEANDAARKLLHLGDDAAQQADSFSPFDHLRFESPETATVVTERFPWQRAMRGKATTAEYRVRRRTEDGGVDSRSAVLQIAASPGLRGTAVVNVRDITTRHGLHEDLQQAYARIVEAHTAMQQRTKQLEGLFVSAVRQLSAAVGASTPFARALTSDARLVPELREPARQVIDALRVHDRLVHHYLADHVATDTRQTDAPIRAATDMHALLTEAERLVVDRFHNAAGRIVSNLQGTHTRSRVDAALVRHAFWSVLAHAASQASKMPARMTTADLPSEETDGPRLRVAITWPGTRANTAELTLARALIESERGTFTLETADGETTATMDFAISVDPRTDATPASNDAKAAGRPLRVLLVEDHESTARVLTRQLSRLRCDVALARTLAEAHIVVETPTAGRGAAATAPNVELVVCDLTMPDGNALEFVRRAVLQRRIPTIGLRSYGGALARDLGADDDELHIKAAAGDAAFEELTKPVDLNALAAAIARITGRTGTGRP